MDQDLIQELYQSLIIDHSKKPRNFGTIDIDKHLNCLCSKGKNPACGDELELFIIIENNQLKEVKFTGQGCSLFMSSSSLMTQSIKNKNKDEIKKLLENFIKFIVEEKELNDDYEPLHIYQTVHNFPLRVKCVLLPWRALEKVIQQYEEKEVKNG